MQSLTRKFGIYEVTRLQDGQFQGSPDMVIVTDDVESVDAQPPGEYDGAGFVLDVNCFLLSSDSKHILIDSGVGEAWGDTFGHARILLSERNILPEQVDAVILTHLHEDHALGLFCDQGAYFTNAHIYVPSADLAHYCDSAAQAEAPDTQLGAFQMAEKLLKYYSDRLTEISPGEIIEGIQAIELYGHTPGHTGYLIPDENSPLLIWGDSLHLEELQMEDPRYGLVFDNDRRKSVCTRRNVLGLAADHGWAIAGNHMADYGRVARVQIGYQLMPA